MVGHEVLACVEAVVFDLDDTLFDHTGSTRRALDEWLQTLDAKVTPQLVARWSDAEARHFEAWRAGAISFQEQRRRRLRDFLPLVDRDVRSDAELDSIFVGYLRCYEKAWQAFDDVQPALTELAARGLVLAVLTNGSAAQQSAKVTRIGIADHLAAVITSEELGVAKPEAAAYLAACERIRSEPGRTLHVGDRRDLDVVGARAAGLPALHLDRLGRSDEAREDRLYDLAELTSRLREL